MDPVFSSLMADLGVAALCGLLGGFGLGMLQDNGIELPRRRKKKETSEDGAEQSLTFYFDLGFLADMLVGALAAVIVYALNQPSDELQLVAMGLTSGLGGAGILKGYVQAQKNQELSGLAQEALTLASMQVPAAPVVVAPPAAAAPGDAGDEIEAHDIFGDMDDAVAAAARAMAVEDPFTAPLPAAASSSSPHQERINVLQQRVDELTRRPR